MLKELIDRLLGRIQQRGLRLIRGNSGLQENSFRPCGFMLATEEVWIDAEPLERKVERNGTTYSSIINDFRVISPKGDYPLMVPAHTCYWPNNHFDMGLFGSLGYVIQDTQRDLLKIACLQNVRLAHVHYPYQERPIFVDIGDHTYGKIASKIDIDLFPKGCSPHDLFNDMHKEVKDLAEKYL